MMYTAVAIMFSLVQPTHQMCRVSDIPDLTMRVRPPNYNATRETYSIIALFPAKLKARFNRSGFVWMEVAKFAFLEMLERIKELTAHFNLELVISDTCNNITIATAYAVSAILDARDNYEQVKCCERERNQNVIGFVGPAASKVTENFAMLFPEIYPVLSYSSTSVSFDDKFLFPNFMRTIPPDNLQATLMVDLVKHYNWTYVSIVAYDDQYGRMGMEELRKGFAKNNICTAIEATYNNVNGIHTTIQALRNENKSNVVILWATGSKSQEFLNVSVQLKLEGKTFILTESVNKNPTISTYNPRYMQGVLSIVPNSASYTAFIEYFRKVTYRDAGEHNPWLKRFYEKYTEISRDEYNTTPIYKFRNELPMSKNGYVRNAVYAYGHAIKEFINDPANNCSGQTNAQRCMRSITADRSEFLTQYLKKVSFLDLHNETMTFDDKGNPNSAYFTISSLQRTNNGKLQWKDVGTWERAQGMKMFNTPFNWTGNSNKIPQSSCGKSCNPGFAHVAGSKSCCWACVQCQGDRIKDRSGPGTCQACPNKLYANEEHTACLPVEYIYSQITGTPLILVCFLMVVNATLAISFAAIFIRFRKTPVVHSSQFHLSLVQLFSTLLVNFASTVKMWKPTKTACIAFSSILPFLVTCAIAPTILKTQRLVTIFHAKNRIVTKWQIQLRDAVKIFFLICIQALLFVLSYSFSKISGTISLLNTETSIEHIQVGCDTSLTFYTEIAYLLLIFIVCGVATFKARDLPTNYNESRVIAYTMFTCSVLLIFVIPLHESVASLKSKTLIMVFTLLLFDFFILVFLYTHKIWIILFQPELNTDKAFAANRMRNINEKLEEEIWHQTASKEHRQSFHHATSDSPLTIHKGNKMVDSTDADSYDSNSPHTPHRPVNNLHTVLHSASARTSFLRESYKPRTQSGLVLSETKW